LIREEEGDPTSYSRLMILTIFNLTEEDFDTYRCLARNAKGESHGDIKLLGKSSFFWH